jgi:predicted nuclease of restriction endonuclease-like (RecB) superfamily
MKYRTEKATGKKPSFAEAYPDRQIVKQLVSQLPWGHNIRLLQRIKDLDKRLWYIKMSIQ